MAIKIEKRIDLTEYDDTSPFAVSQLSIIHEANNGEIVRYYISPVDHTEHDRASNAIGVYDRETDSWSYHDYDELEWGEPRSRITYAETDIEIERLGVKAFPGIGSFAFYKKTGKKLSRIVIPVNRQSVFNETDT